MSDFFAQVQQPILFPWPHVDSPVTVTSHQAADSRIRPSLSRNVHIPAFGEIMPNMLPLRMCLTSSSCRCPEADDIVLLKYSSVPMEQRQFWALAQFLYYEALHV